MLIDEGELLMWIDGTAEGQCLQIEGFNFLSPAESLFCQFPSFEGGKWDSI